MIHSTTADRAADGSSEVISLNHQLGYQIHEVLVKPAEKDKPLAIKPGMSFYCISGRGWASIPGGQVKYALEPGVIISAPPPQTQLHISATEELKVLQIAYSGTGSPWSI